MGYELYKRGSKWHVYFIDREGGRFRKSTKQADKRRAVVVADEWYRRLADPTYSAANATTIQQAADRLREALKRAKRSPETIDHFYRIKLSQVARVMGADTVLARIDARAVDAFIATREAEGASSHTISKELTALRQLLKHARRRGEFDKELSQVMPIGFATGYKPRQRRLTEREAWDFIRELPDGIARYAAFVCATTARDKAVGRARGRHLVTDGIEVLDRKTKRATRTVPMNDVTEPFARFAFDGIGPDDPVAPGITSVRHAFDRAAARLKFAHVSPNDLRRSVAHWLLERGVPRDAAAAFLGHANTKMLDAVYGKLDVKELGASIRRSLLLGPGSSVEGTWKTDPDPVTSVDSLDSVSAENQCAGTESNRRHGDFQSPIVSHNSAETRARNAIDVDGTWISVRSDKTDELAHPLPAPAYWRTEELRSQARGSVLRLGGDLKSPLAGHLVDALAAGAALYGGRVPPTILGTEVAS